MVFFGNDADYIVFEDSDDDEDGESSDENDDFLWLLSGNQNDTTFKTNRKRKVDDFETEMNKELNDTMNVLHASNKLLSSATIDKQNSITQKSGDQQSGSKYYDDIYFDSDDETEQECNSGSNRKSKRKHPVISNDDLFYDPTMDQADQDWVDERRLKYTAHPKPGTSATSHRQRLPNSDAVLNCPACMSTLCHDCQRHDVYKGQYRAMFVLNCKIDVSKTLRYPQNNKKKFKPKKRNEEEKVEDAGAETYHPVYCSICNTEVAVQDQEEIYHFFNVLASFA